MTVAFAFIVAGVVIGIASALYCRQLPTVLRLRFCSAKIFNVFAGLAIILGLGGIMAALTPTAVKKGIAGVIKSGSTRLHARVRSPDRKAGF